MIMCFKIQEKSTGPLTCFLRSVRRKHSATECPRANHISRTPQKSCSQTQHVTGSYCIKQTRKVTARITEISAGICQGTNTHTTYCLTVCLCPRPAFSVNFLSYAHFSVWHLFSWRLLAALKAMSMAYSRDLHWTTGEMKSWRFIRRYIVLQEESWVEEHLWVQSATLCL